MNDPIALVTGASRGIGKVVAQQMAEAGYQVIGTATSEAGAEAIQAGLSPYGGHGRVLKLGDHAAMTAQFESIVASIGAPQVLVNNAGMTDDNLAIRMKADEWNEVINVNLSSVFFLTHLAIKNMINDSK